MPKCGSQCWLCDLPIRYDTYAGCAHACAYCFAQRDRDISVVKPDESPAALRAFIDGQRGYETKWCDWDIPLHIGGMSDPFQPCEAEQKRTLKSLEVLREAHYPFVISTKGRLIAEPEYLEILDGCNVVAQISAACGKYDKMELGAPPFEERMQIAGKVAPHCRRLIIRVQPYLRECKKDILAALSQYRDAGAYGIVIEGMKFPSNLKNVQGKNNFTKVEGDLCYRREGLAFDFAEIKRRAHELGLAFYCGENRLRNMGDSLTCCGVDGLEGFRPNHYNVMHLIHDDVPPEPTERMKEVGTADSFKAIYQSTIGTRVARGASFQGMMLEHAKEPAVAIATGVATERPEVSKAAVQAFVRWFRSTGITAAEINELTGTYMGRHYLALSSQQGIPTEEAWQKICKSPKLKGKSRMRDYFLNSKAGEE